MAAPRIYVGQCGDYGQEPYKTARPGEPGSRPGDDEGRQASSLPYPRDWMLSAASLRGFSTAGLNSAIPPTIATAIMPAMNAYSSGLDAALSETKRASSFAIAGISTSDLSP
jgi:hypothetical protein